MWMTRNNRIRYYKTRSEQQLSVRLAVIQQQPVSQTNSPFLLSSFRRFVFRGGKKRCDRFFSVSSDAFTECCFWLSKKVRFCRSFALCHTPSTVGQAGCTLTLRVHQINTVFFLSWEDNLKTGLIALAIEIFVENAC
jgi:hypothetical protein